MKLVFLHVLPVTVVTFISAVVLIEHPTLAAPGNMTTASVSDILAKTAIDEPQRRFWPIVFNVLRGVFAASDIIDAVASSESEE